MTPKVLTFTLAAHLAAFSAAAQTAGIAGAQTGSAADTGTAAGIPATSETFGADWSMILGSAMFEMDGRTIRPDDELLGQWGTLSEQDRDIIRRDCVTLEAQAEGMPGAAALEPDGASAGVIAPDTGSQPSAGAGTGGGAAQTGTLEDTDPVGSVSEQSGAAGRGGGSAQPGSPIVIELSAEQMEQICDVLEDEL